MLLLRHRQLFWYKYVELDLFAVDVIPPFQPGDFPVEGYQKYHNADKDDQ
jgi:hypothetical protein